MKPGMAWREEPWWHWDWPGRPEGYVQQGNGVSALSGAEGTQQRSWKYIYVPDPESRNGWRQSVVYSDPPPPPEPRKAGFK